MKCALGTQGRDAGRQCAGDAPLCAGLAGCASASTVLASQPLGFLLGFHDVFSCCIPRNVFLPVAAGEGLLFRTPVSTELHNAHYTLRREDS